jgi:oligopeptide/dipeptide ABC transporter ATP-binding protein
VTAPPPGEVVLEVRDLRTHFVTRRGVGRAVDGVSFDLHRGETLGLVGESGCGKSVTCLSIVRLHPRPAARIVGGQVRFGGVDLLALPESIMRRYRGRHLAMILQDPMTALNPVFTIGNQLAEPLRLHGGLRGRRLWQRAAEAMRLVRIPAPEARLRAYPHQLSGGMRQRAVGAIALSCEPDVLIADEPTTALDVTIQAAYLALLREIQARTGLAILFVTHDFAVVARMCDRVAVMYAGRIVELGDTATVLARPAHPYTEALLRSVPDLDAPPARLYSIEGQPPSIYAPAPGCPFAPRCPLVEPRCRVEFPPARTPAPGQTVSCWRHVS